MKSNSRVDCRPGTPSMSWAMQRLVAVVLVAAATSCMTACSSGSDGAQVQPDGAPHFDPYTSHEVQGKPGHSGQPSADPRPLPRCVSGDPCTCPDGRNGSTSCSSVEPTCNCDGCSQFVEPTPVPYEACGGDVTGAWKLDEVDASNLKLEMYSRDFTSGLGKCPAALRPDPSGDEIASGVVEFVPDGEAHVRVKIKPFKFAVEESCVRTVVAAGCAAFGGACTASCGICECDGKSMSVEEDQAKWELKSTELKIDDTHGGGFEGEYCVRGDTLLLKLRLGSGMVLKFKRFTYFSAKTPCSIRSPEECLVGPGCDRGVCTGPAECDPKLGDWACTASLDCWYDRDACFDSTIPPCSATSVGVDPGCLPAEGKVCVGTATACSKLSGNSCVAQVGCKKLTACYRPWPCDFYKTDQQRCTHVGCRWHPEQGCIETDRPCSALQTEEYCTAFDGCQYDASRHCEGTAKPCSSLTLSECSHQTGCTISSAAEADVEGASPGESSEAGR